MCAPLSTDVPLVLLSHLNSAKCNERNLSRQYGLICAKGSKVAILAIFTVHVHAQFRINVASSL